MRKTTLFLTAALALSTVGGWAQKVVLNQAPDQATAVTEASSISSEKYYVLQTAGQNGKDCYAYYPGSGVLLANQLLAEQGLTSPSYLVQFEKQADSDTYKIKFADSGLYMPTLVHQTNVTLVQSNANNVGTYALTKQQESGVWNLSTTSGGNTVYLNITANKDAVVGTPVGWNQMGENNKYKILEVSTTTIEANTVNAYTAAKAADDNGTVWSAVQVLYGAAKLPSQLSTNAQSNQEGPIADLIDGKPTTHFHSTYADKTDACHYLQVHMGDEKSVGAFYIYLRKRSSNNNNRPTKIKIEGSNDGTEFTEVTSITEGLPTDASVVDYISASLGSDVTKYCYLRFSVEKTNSGQTVNEDSDHPYFTMSEFYVLPVTTECTAAIEKIKAFRALTKYNDEGFATKATAIADMAAPGALGQSIYQANLLHTSVEALKGDGLGQYPESAISTLAAAITTATEALSAADATTESCNNAATALDAACLTCRKSINQPEDGKVYKIVNLMGDPNKKTYWYMTAENNRKLCCTQLNGNEPSDKSHYFVAVREDGKLYLASYNGLGRWAFSNPTHVADKNGLEISLSNSPAKALGNYNVVSVSGSTERVIGSYTPSGGTNLAMGVYTWNDKQGYYQTYAENGSTEVILEEVTNVEGFEATVTEGANGNFGTLCLPYATTVPTGVTCNKVTVANNVATYEPMVASGAVLPANTPALLTGNPGKHYFSPAATAAAISTGNLKGTLFSQAIKETGKTILILAAATAAEAQADETSAPELGFFLLNLTTEGMTNVVNANKAYLSVNGTMTANSLKLIAGGEATGIDAVQPAGVSAQPMYDLSGRRITSAPRGTLYLQGGKKYLAK